MAKHRMFLLKTALILRKNSPICVSDILKTLEMAGICNIHPSTILGNLRDMYQHGFVEKISQEKKITGDRTIATSYWYLTEYGEAWLKLELNNKLWQINQQIDALNMEKKSFEKLLENNR